ncbi:MAG: methyltransferase [Pirellulales bacterium]|nr:methyltransferase [Pirellulales bacterium]
MIAPTTDAGQAPRQLMKLVTGGWVAQTISVAARLGLADLLAEGPRSASELAAETNAHPRSLYRLLRALAVVGVFEELSDEQFQLTPLAELLRTDASHSLRYAAIMLGENHHYGAWGNLLGAVQSGGIAFNETFGVPVFDYFQAHPEAADVFNRAMTELSSNVHVAVVDAYDFTPFETIVDIGGGHGALLSAILRANPKLRGVLFDQPDVVAGAEPHLEARGVAERCHTAPGDFFQSVPAGGDAYLLATVIHDWTDEQSVQILRNVRRAIRPNGRLLLVEQVLQGPNADDFGKFADLNMLVMTGGGERTEAEFRELYARAGFELLRIVPTRSSSAVIEGAPVD